MKKEKWRTLHCMDKAYLLILEPVITKYGMTKAEMDVLLFLANNPDYDRAADVVELRGLTKSHVSIAVKALCKKGFLQSRQDENDRRVTRLKITKQAQPAVTEGQLAQNYYFSQLFSGFTQEEKDWWYKLQGKIMENMKILLEQ